MDSWDTERLVADDKRYVWHPFTSMAEWCAPEHEPIVLVSGEGAIVRDSRGREYIDGNSSIWTNIHGHNHPRINAAIGEQLGRVAHTSFLGTTNPPAIQLARAIVSLFPEEKFGRVFYSDDGSTGMEAAMRIVSQYWRLQGSDRRTFVAFRDAYHGDTAGAASLGAGTMFGAGISGFQFPVERVGDCEQLAALPEQDKIAAVAIEPIIQGAAGMKIWPPGTLQQLREWCDASGALLIADEVMTGFGRTGKMFACEHESVQPDLYVFAKGLTGGYLPLALTLVSNKVFEPFLRSDPAATMFYGHSYTGNALGCAAALASLEIFRTERTLETLPPKIEAIREGLAAIGELSAVSDTRSCGMIGAFDLQGESTLAARVCQDSRERGLLTRHIRNTVILMPPLVISTAQVQKSLTILKEAVQNVITCKTDVASAAS
ncbi:MAG TPA: adenosylmethionine--8-amino-7-oxononanoate transaminase [Chthoniobacterales bacterium]|nr:adenosylmethionine--8-amino-7-oxononanoate transaminase [Chthoniobacterales bacterium]